MSNVVNIDSRWHSKLQPTSTGTRRPNLFNCAVVLRHAPEFRHMLVYNSFSMMIEVSRPPPWDRDDDKDWDANDDLCFVEWLQDNGIQASVETANAAVQLVAYERRYHPVRDWLSGLKWDGQDRVGDWLTYYLGVERTPYSQAVGQAWLISAVARVMVPGCKADHMLILEGQQGLKKSGALQSLTGDAWFTDDMADLGSKDASMQMRGAMVIELAELDQMGRVDMARIKAFVARRIDRFRPPYGRSIITAPRECVFAGTINPEGGGYLKDFTGNRRFWPVRVVSVDIDALAADREQIWAEAVALYRAGEKWWLQDEEMIAAAAEEQESRREADPWEPTVEDWLERQAVPAIGGWSTTQVIRDGVGKRLEDITDRDNKRVSRILKFLGYERRSARVPGSHRVTKIWIES